MRAIKKIIILGLTGLIIFICIGYLYAKIPLPGRAKSWVNDYAGVIDAETKGRLENVISSIRQKTEDPVEVIIGVFPSIEGWDFNDFAFAYGEQWREVKKGKRDNGIVIVLVLREGRVSIGVGKNLKGVLNDAAVKDIITNVMIPEFAKGNYSQGIENAVGKIIGIVENAKIPSGSDLFTLQNILIVFTIIIALFFVRRLVSQAKRLKQAPGGK